MLAMACTSMAAAQGTDTEAAPAVAQSNADEAEIVVTANKREQRLHDVGLAVAVVGGDALKKQQISSMADIAQSFPGLSFTPTATSTPVYTLRGIGFSAHPHVADPHASKPQRQE